MGIFRTRRFITQTPCRFLSDFDYLLFIVRLVTNLMISRVIAQLPNNQKWTQVTNDDHSFSLTASVSHSQSESGQSNCVLLTTEDAKYTSLLTQTVKI